MALLLILIPGMTIAQDGRIAFSDSTRMADGLYSGFRDVLQNTPSDETFTLAKWYDKQYPVMKTPFGCVNEGVLYVFFQNQFFKVVRRGAISVFYMVLQYQVTGSYSMWEDKIYVIDFSDGRIMKLSLNNLEPVLMRDPALYEEFSKHSTGSKRKSLLGYINRYNQRNPVYME